jgi:protein-tyrosine-phosphatase/DNA-binding transcriptional ArsR family regulator
MERTQRAAIHRALGDEVRLQIIDELAFSDRTPQDLARLAGSETNLLAHHLGVLEEAGLIRRRVSSGDRRRRYISLESELVRGLLPELRLAASSVVFVCTHNTARSQVAEALFRSRSGVRVQSAGPNPRPSVHPKAIQVGAELGADLSGHRPKGYSEVAGSPDLVVSVCDLALEATIPFHVQRLHWSIPDPVETGRVEDFRSAFTEIDRRVGLLADAIDNERSQP